jgi:hypothetical protein
VPDRARGRLREDGSGGGGGRQAPGRARRAKRTRTGRRVQMVVQSYPRPGSTELRDDPTRVIIRKVISSRAGARCISCSRSASGGIENQSSGRQAGSPVRGADRAGAVGPRLGL